MSKNTNLSFLTDYITADITNGRIGINNASPTVAFDVVGATKITGVLTLTSTISNGTYAYTLPSATGTLALTSALSGYLPLTGGTLTGALIGTSATFSGNVVLGTTALTGGGAAQWITTNGTSYGGGLISSVNGVVKAYYYYDNNANAAMVQGIVGVGVQLWANNAVALSIATTGAATFSSSVTAGSSGQAFMTGNAGTSSIGMRFTNTGGNSFIGLSNSVGTGYLSGTAYAFNIQTEGAQDLQFGTNNANRLIIHSTTGAATFSSGVTSNVNDGSAGFNVQPTTTTNSAYVQFLNADGYGYIGKNSSAGGNLASGTSAYALVMSTYKSGGTTAPIQFAPNNSIAMTITSAGNVGIGTTSPSTFLTVVGVNTSNRGQLSIQSSDTNNAALATWYYATTKVGGIGSTSTDFYGEAVNNYLFYAGGAERMRITSAGAATFSNFNGAALYGVTIKSNNDTGTQYMMSFERIGNQAGYIASTSSTTVGIYSTSDYRLKEDLQSFNGIDKLMSMNFYDFKWKVDGGIRDYGVIAHELQDILPSAVIGEKDGEKNQAVDYAKLIPIMAKAIQELSAEITLLKNK